MWRDILLRYTKIYNNKKKKPKYLFNCYGSTELSPWVFSYKFNRKDLKDIKKIGLVPIGKNFITQRLN